MRTDPGTDLLRQDGYTYFAFISYRRTDSVWAMWLKRRLQSYRLPQRTRKNHRELPQRFSSVFLDKTNLTPGLLDEGLRSEVQASKYLIVVCSRSVREKPQYIDQEIQYFLDGGGDPSRIIPFIVDDAPRPEEDCFPPKLQELCRKQTILGANIYDSGKRSAFLKVIAYMHGLRLEEIESDDLRRRRKNLACWIAAALVLLGGSGAGAYRYWDYNAPKTFYYQDYVERYGLPEGIGPMEAAEAAASAGHYTMITRQGKVRELRYENAYGRPLSHSGMADHDRPTRALYEYAEDGTLDRVFWYDSEAALITVLNYSNLQTVDLQAEQSDSYVGSAFLRAYSPLESASGEPLVPPNVTRFLLDYDENGFVTEQRFVNNPAYNDVASDSDGVAGYRYERDAEGRTVKLWYLAYIGERGSARDPEDYAIVGLKNGVCGISFTYNEQNELTEYCYLNKDGAPIRNSRGFSIARLRYDTHHNQIETRYYDVEGNAVRQAGGYAVYALAYDGSGNRIAMHFYGTAGESAANTDGYAAALIRYDENGRMEKADFLGTDGKPVLIIDGYASTEYRYDADGHLTEQRWFGVDGAPILTREGCAGQSWIYDENGRAVQTAYYGTDGKRCLTNGGYSEVRMTLDGQGRCVRLLCCDEDGAPVLTADGYSAFEQQYDEFGNLEELRCYGTDGQLLCFPAGYAVIRRVFDERGNTIVERYFDENGAPVMVLGGYAELRQTFDGSGNITRRCAYDTDGRLVMLPEGYAILQQSFDKRGNCLEMRYLDTNENPVTCEEGCAVLKQQYDERGNLIRTDCFGPDGQPILCTGGYASCLLQLDENGQVVEVSYLGVDGKAVKAAGGYAYALYEYDANGRILTEGYFDENEQLTLCREGYAVCRVFYDEGGMIRADFYDAESHYLGSQTDFD